MVRGENPARGYQFLHKSALSQSWFSESELATGTGWKQSSVRTYISKQWKDFLNVEGKGPRKKYQVRKDFLRISETEFLDFFTQRRLLVPRYQRSKHEMFLQFEFLLPLSKEEHLRRALDELFYSDTLVTRINELGLDNLKTIIFRDDADSDSEYVTKILSTLNEYFGGYSVSHVQGRFRAADLTDIRGAAQSMIEHGRYLIDETTAVVRFIVKCNSTQKTFDDNFDSIVAAIGADEDVDSVALCEEMRLIRCLFFFFFVETVVRTVKGEDEIWLLETGSRRRLYRWTKT